MTARAGQAATATAAFVGEAAAALAPWRDLAVRLLLAQAFLSAGALRMTHGVALGAVPATLLGSLAGSMPGLAVQVLAPALLAVGLFTRLAAAALLIQIGLLAAVAPGVSPWWAVLLGWLLVSGPGGLSVDGPLAPAMRGGALPGAEAVGRVFGWTRRHVGPWLLAAARIGAGVLAGGAALGLADRGWPAVPPAVAAMPAWLAVAAGVLLLAGLAARPVALALLAAGIAGGMDNEARLFWLGLLALPAVSGGGALAADAAVAAWLRRRWPRVSDLDAAALAGLPHVVIVGGGFGGIEAARRLRHAPCRITLIDRRNFTLFQPLLYQVATAGLAPADIATPIRAMFRHDCNVRVLLGEVTGVDTAAQAVRIGDDAVPYTLLVLATGARHAYFGRDDWAPLAPGLKQVEDATDIRGRLLAAFEAAERAADAAARQAWLTFVVVGGGPTGVELAGAIAELAHNSLADEFRAADPRQARVILVQAEARVLPSFPAALSARAAAALRRLGVELLTGRRVTGIDDEGVVLDGEARIAARTVLWAAGVMASPAAAWLGIAADRAGRLPVGPDLTVAGAPAVFAIGDTVASASWNGKPAPGLAPAAKQMGAYAARAIRARLAGRGAPAPFRYRHQGSLATIGRAAAVADFGWLRLAGAPAWWLWGGVHLAFLVSGRNRLTVMVAWLWAYLTWRSGSRLITGEAAAPVVAHA